MICFYADLHADRERGSSRRSDPRGYLCLRRPPSRKATDGQEASADRRVYGSACVSASRGFTLVEAVAALGVFVIIAATVLTLALDAFSADQRTEQVITAQALASEGLEAARSIRNANFSDLIIGSFGLATTAGYWTLNGSSETIGSHTRTIQIGSVYRNNGGRGTIVSAGSPGATVDPYSRYVTSMISWLSPLGMTNSFSLSSLFTQWSVHQWQLDTLADFSSGRLNSVQLASLGNGEVKLADFRDWTLATVTQTIDIGGNDDGVDCAVDPNNDALAIITEERGSGRPEFYNYDLADVTATTTGLFTLGFTEIGDSPNAMSVHNGYAYLATSRNGQELMVIRLSDYAKLSSWHTPGTNENANDVAASGSVAYLVTDKAGGGHPEFYAVDITNPTAIPAVPVGTAEINHTVLAVAISADAQYAFLATNDDDGELVVVRLSDYAVVKTIDVEGNGKATDVAVAGTTVYITKERQNGEEFFAFDASNPQGMSATPLGSTELNTDVTHLALHGGRAYLTTKNGSKELVVVSLATYQPVAMVNLPGTADAVSVCAYGAHAYVVSNYNNGEVMVVSGGGSTASYAVVGSYTSPNFDSGSAGTSWGAIFWVASGTGTVKFRVRTADTAAHLMTAQWVGSDGTTNTFYTSSGQSITLDPAATGRRWIQFKAYFETSSASVTPVLESVTLTYD